MRTVSRALLASPVVSAASPRSQVQVPPLLQALTGKDGFLQKERLENYDALRNKPMEDATSNLSGWLHFGHISQQRVGLEAGKLKSAAKVSASNDVGVLAAEWLCLPFRLGDGGHGSWQAQKRLQGQHLV